MIELLSPAGNEEKLRYAYLYGADAVYIGLGSFSLRAKADNFFFEERHAGPADLPGETKLRPILSLPERLREIKGKKKLYGAFNIFFREDDINALEAQIEEIAELPFDALIVSDLGAFSLLRRRLPQTRLSTLRFHLSTQANCLNSEAVKFYRDLGFSRIILGRETTLEEIERIRLAVPDIELEVFVHGAMCLAYSGRCYLSAYLTGRSANRGDCTHSCRWLYRVLEEKERPGEYFPVIKGEDYTTILSSKDLNMFDHLGRLKDAGVDSLKIEGRMKSLYYTAVVTRAYRRALDRLIAVEHGHKTTEHGSPTADELGHETTAADDEELALHREELYNVSHREYSTGFYFGKRDADETAEGSYRREYEFLGLVGEPARPTLGEAFRPTLGEPVRASQGDLIHPLYRLEVRNSISEGEEIEFIGPDILLVKDNRFELYDQEGNRVGKAVRGPEDFYIRPSVSVSRGYIIRKKRADPSP